MEPDKDKAKATLLRTDGIEADSADLVDFEDLRYAGHYVILRCAGEVVGIYKQVARFGQAKPVRTEGGGVAFQIDSISFGLKRIKRAPKGLLGNT